MSKDKPLSPSKATAAKTIFRCFEILKAAGGELSRKELLTQMTNSLQFDAYESALLESNGQPRWLTVFLFYTVDANKAGYLLKNKGTWILTPEGEKAMSLGAVGLIDAANKAYKVWASQQVVDDSLKEVSEIKDEPIFEKQQKALLDQYEATAYEGLRQHVLNKNPYEFQDLVAALLSAMGYFISHIAPKGKDGGIDIIAYNDPLGTKPPRMVIQVKHRPSATIPSDDVQRLAGTMKRETDVGIFVTSGDFSSPAKNEARIMGKHIELIDFDRFIDLWTQYYPKMDDKDKNMLPLRPIYFLEAND